MWQYNYSDELYHFGKLGMKWGVRRYQNADGSLTEAGKKRYARDAKENNWEIGEDGIARSTSKKTKGEIRTADPNKWVKEDTERTKKLVDNASQMTNKLKEVDRQSLDNAKKKRPRMDLSEMTEKEMRERINREMLEKQYNDVFNPPNVSRGRQYVSKALETTGTTLGLLSSSLGIALAIKELRG